MLHHITVTTGHLNATHRADVADHIIAMLRPMTVAGTHPLTFDGRDYQVLVAPESVNGAWGFDVRTGGTILVYGMLCTRAASSERAWAYPVHMAQTVGLPVVATRPAAPWLAVVPLHGLALYPDVASWIGDFERCLAFAIIEATAGE